MFGSLFKKRKKKASVDPSSLVDRIVDARPGDVFTIAGYAPELEDAYLIIDEMNRYESGGAVWFELLGADGDKKLWLNWSDGGGLQITVSVERRPMGLKTLDIAEDDLARMDQEHSIDNFIGYDGSRYYYQNSGEAVFFRNNTGSGEGFYLWDFAAEDDSKMLSIDKWEGLPFQGYVSDVVSPDSVTVYKR